MSFTPLSWVGEQLSKLRVGGTQLRSRFPTDAMPAPILKALFIAVILLLFVDEFLVLAALFGGPIALAILLAFAGSVWWARNTTRGRRLRDRSSRTARRLTTGSKTRRYSRRKDD